MKSGGRQRWLVLMMLLTLALTAAAWVRDSGNRLHEAVVEPPVRSGRAARIAVATPRDDRVALEKLGQRTLDANEADPFAPRSWTKPVAPRTAVARPVAPAPAQAAAPPPTAPPLPFVYLGRIAGEEENAVFLALGDRNLIVREGDEINAVYRVERLAGSGVTLVHLPTGIRQTLATRGVQ